MTNLKKRLEELEERQFLLKMIDRWTAEDYKEYDKVTDELLKVRKQLKEEK